MSLEEAPVFSIEKNPAEYDEYECTLSEELRKKAKDELRENDSLREQSLTQFREWISKHPYIKKCRTDSIFLLRFLRVRKFNFLESCEMLERYLTIRQICPEWFKNLDILDPNLEAIVESGLLMPLRDIKKTGCLTTFQRVKNYDPKKHSAAALLRLYHLMLEIYLEDEKVQVIGTDAITDVAGASIDYVMMLTLTEYKKAAEYYQNVIPIRRKKIFVSNIPTIAVKLVNLLISFVSEKLRERIYCPKSNDELVALTGREILPKEDYGGEISAEDLKDNFRKLAMKYRNRILAMEHMEIEITKNSKYWQHVNTSEIDAAPIGSFRRLEVD